MSAVVIPSGFGIATAVWLNSGGAKEYSCTMGFSNDIEELDGDVIAAQIAAFWTATGNPCEAAMMTPTWTFDRLSVLFRDASEDLRSGSSTVGIAGTMATAGQPQPAFASLVVSKGTALSGRAFRGRMYPPMTYATEGSVDVNGRIENAVALPAIRAAYDGLFASWSVSSFPPFLLHAADSTPGPATAPTSINDLVVKPIVGSQRRRKPRT